MRLVGAQCYLLLLLPLLVVEALLLDLLQGLLHWFLLFVLFFSRKVMGSFELLTKAVSSPYDGLFFVGSSTNAP